MTVHQLHKPSCPHPYAACTCDKKEEARYGDWMQTHSGIAFWPLDPRPEDILAADIAHALAQICRYGGHTKFFYSVAEHSVHVSEWVESVTGPRDALMGLMHDASEAYLGDMVRPLKRHMAEYRDVEEHLMGMIAHKWGLDPEPCEAVKEADNRILLDERDKLMTLPPPRPWRQDEQGLKPLGVNIACWTPSRAKSEFLTRLSYLKRVLDASGH